MLEEWPIKNEVGAGGRGGKSDHSSWWQKFWDNPEEQEGGMVRKVP